MARREHTNASPGVWFVAALATASAVTAPAGSARGEPESRPTPSNTVLGPQLTRGSLSGFNLLFITLDTVRMDHIGCYGYADARTPTIDALAARGVQFDHAITGNPSTLPSHCTMMTGLEVPTHGARTNAKFALDQKVTTLAEVLAGRGYATAAVVATLVLDSQFGLDQGFDRYDDRITPQPRRADRVTNVAIDWLERHLDGAPPPAFFLWVHYFDPHKPYDPPAPFAAFFQDRPYDAEIAFVDHELRRLLAFLDGRNLTSRTLIVVASDHGEGLGEHGEEDHSRLIYDTTVRIPLILSCPPVFEAPRRIDDVTVGTIDIMPTVLSLLGVETGLQMDGVDLTTTSISRDRAIYLETLAPLVYHGWAPLHGLRRIEGKYIQAPLPEYYDLRHDPHELQSLLETNPGVADKAAAELAALMRRWPPVEKTVPNAKPMNRRFVERLASLGYVTTVAPGDPPPSKRADPKDMVPLFRALNDDSPEQLHAKSREVVQVPGANRGTYRRALILAEVAYKQAPDNIEYLTTLGLAQYRAGRHAEALTTLLEAQKKHAERGEEVDAVAEAFTAMALHRLNRRDAARARLDRLRALMEHDKYAGDVAAHRLFAEAETLISGG